LHPQEFTTGGRFYPVYSGAISSPAVANPASTGGARKVYPGAHSYGGSSANSLHGLAAGALSFSLALAGCDNPAGKICRNKFPQGEVYQAIE